MIFPFFTYAEIHYRIKFLPSSYFKKEPEIIVDVPKIIENKKKIPIFLMIKDADKFPIFIEEINIFIKNQNGVVYKEKISLNRVFREHFAEEIFYIEQKFGNGDYNLICTVWYKRDKKFLKCINDNYDVKNKNISFTILSSCRPNFSNQFYGDCHYHSYYTNDFVEFGASLETTKIVLDAMGYDYAFITDHSYDLDDAEFDYKINDENLPKWEKLKTEVQAMNNQNKIKLIFGEEISCGNSKSKNIHFCIMNNEQFYAGCGDGAEEWFNYKIENKLNDLLRIKQNTNLLFAAHPFCKPNILEKLLLNRGSYSEGDLEKCDILQIYNGQKDKAFFKGMQYWISELLKGKKKYIIAGNDAHGNFSCTRTIKYPMWKISKNDNYFGKAFTAVISEDLSVQSIIDAVNMGRIYISEGPVIDYWINGKTFGGAVREGNSSIRISVKSIPEFGKITKIQIYYGVYIQNNETLTNEIILNEFSFQKQFNLCLERAGYIRVYLVTDKNRELWSNPVFVEN